MSASFKTVNMWAAGSSCRLGVEGAELGAGLVSGFALKRSGFVRTISRSANSMSGEK